LGTFALGYPYLRMCSRELDGLGLRSRAVETIIRKGFRAEPFKK
jgi:hypothetical protein